MTRTGDTVRLLTPRGKTLDTQTVTGATALLAGYVGSTPALIAVGHTELVTWVGSSTRAQRVAVDAAATVAVRGFGVVVTTPSQVSVLTAAGLAPYTSPRAGTAPLAVETNGSLQWASTRGEVLTASAAGTTISSTSLTPPTEGATVTRWLTGGASTVVVWTLPNGSMALGVHGADGRLVGGPQPIDATEAASPLVLTGNRSMAMFGRTRISLTSPGLAVPDPRFVASKALGADFYGAIGTTPAVLHVDTSLVTEATVTPTVTPVAVTPGGSLITTTAAGHVAVFPKTSAHR